MIRLIMLTGFLGAGKTTLLQKIIEEYSDSKIGVLINEFGAVSIDSELVEGNGIDMTELSNGSIFCACLKDKFVEALVELSGRDIDYLFIEASGLADPANMEDILKGLEEHLVRRYDYVHSVCVVDSTSYPDLIEVLESLDHQVVFSDIIILNKADLVSKDVIEGIRSDIYERNPDAYVQEASYCDVSIRELIDAPSGLMGRVGETTNTFESRPQTLVLKGRGIVPFDELEPFIKEIAPSTYRIKGFFETDKGPVRLDCVGEKILIEPWERELKEAKVVVISSIGIRIVSVITSAMTKYLKGSISL